MKKRMGWMGVSMVVALFASILGCSYTDGPCYRKDSAYWKGEGAGGGVIVPGSVDGYGDAPPDPKGGWQVASTSLKYFRWTSLLPEVWTCPIIVGIPLRTLAYGKVSAQKASNLTAGVASQASSKVMDIKPELPPGIFCFKLKAEMEALFESESLKGYGAKMM